MENVLLSPLPFLELFPPLRCFYFPIGRRSKEPPPLNGKFPHRGGWNLDLKNFRTLRFTCGPKAWGMMDFLILFYGHATLARQPFPVKHSCVYLFFLFLGGIAVDRKLPFGGFGSFTGRFSWGWQLPHSPTGTNDKMNAFWSQRDFLLLGPPTRDLPGDVSPPSSFDVFFTFLSTRVISRKWRAFWSSLHWPSQSACLQPGPGGFHLFLLRIPLRLSISLSGLCGTPPFVVTGNIGGFI